MYLVSSQSDPLVGNSTLFTKSLSRQMPVTVSLDREPARQRPSVLAGVKTRFQGLVHSVGLPNRSSPLIAFPVTRNNVGVNLPVPCLNQSPPSSIQTPLPLKGRLPHVLATVDSNTLLS